LAHGKRLQRRLRCDGPAIVVAVAARARVVLTEVREQERAAATGVLRIAPHHLEPRALDLVLPGRFRVRGRHRVGDVQRPRPADPPPRPPPVQRAAPPASPTAAPTSTRRTSAAVSPRVPSSSAPVASSAATRATV